MCLAYLYKFAEEHLGNEQYTLQTAHLEQRTRNKLVVPDGGKVKGVTS